MRRTVPLFLAALATALALAMWLGDLPPAAWNPYAPIDVAEAPNALTAFKLKLLDTDATLCRAALDSADLRAIPVPDEAMHDGCGLTNAVRVVGAAPSTSPASFLASCPQAVSWAIFLRHGLQAAAERAFGKPIVRIDHLGSYACRPVRGGARPSAHATAGALDISAFVLLGGERISVAQDWTGDGRRAAFLHAARDAACRSFGVVLSPDYDRLHADHLHLQATGRGMCR